MTSLSFLRDTALLKGHSVLVLAENMTYFGSLRDTTLLTGHSVLVQTAALVLATIFLYNAAVCIYNVFFHQLRSYPGPALCALSVWPCALSYAQGRHPQWVKALHERYGPVVRISPNELSYIDSDSWRDIYGTAPGTVRGSITDKWPEFNGYGLFPQVGFPINAIISDSEHARIRKVFAPAFSDKALREQTPLFDHHIDTLIEKLRAAAELNPKGKINLAKWMDLTTFDVMADLVFGRHLGLLESGEYDAWLSNVFNSIRAIAIVGLLRYFPVAKALWLTFIPGFLVRERLKTFEYSAEKVRARLAKINVETKPDVLNMIIASGEKKNISEDEMYWNAEMFLFAGSETTSTATCGAISLLLQHPDKMAKLVAEIRGTFTSYSDITTENIAKLQYLPGVVDESLRVYPSTVQNFPRVVRKGGAVICGRFVPEKTIVCSQIWPAQMSERNFARAEEFIPERWTDPEFSSDNRSSFQVFSYGPRGCLGKSMAYLEIRRILCKLLWTFDIEVCPESKNWTANQKVYVVWVKPNLMVKLKPVKR